MVKIFKASTDTKIILNEVLVNGLAGISGGRVATRQKLRSVACLAEEEGHESVVANSTINHKLTELAFLYDNFRYKHQEASKAVAEAYDNDLALFVSDIQTN